jgi:hypothetical protein
MHQKHSPEEERRIREAALDETLAETFPASDPPSTVPNPDNDEALGGVSVTDTEKGSGGPTTASERRRQR